MDNIVVYGPGGLLYWVLFMLKVVCTNCWDQHVVWWRLDQRPNGISMIAVLSDVIIPVCSVERQKQTTVLYCTWLVRFPIGIAVLFFKVTAFTLWKFFSFIGILRVCNPTIKYNYHINKATRTDLKILRHRWLNKFLK